MRCKQVFNSRMGTRSRHRGRSAIGMVQSFNFSKRYEESDTWADEAFEYVKREDDRKINMDLVPQYRALGLNDIASRIMKWFSK